MSCPLPWDFSGVKAELFLRLSFSWDLAVIQLSLYGHGTSKLYSFSHNMINSLDPKRILSTAHGAQGLLLRLSQLLQQAYFLQFPTQYSNSATLDVLPSGKHTRCFHSLHASVHVSLTNDYFLPAYTFSLEITVNFQCPDLFFSLIPRKK